MTDSHGNHSGNFHQSENHGEKIVKKQKLSTTQVPGAIMGLSQTFARANRRVFSDEKMLRNHDECMGKIQN